MDASEGTVVLPNVFRITFYPVIIQFYKLLTTWVVNIRENDFAFETAKNKYSTPREI